MERDLQVAICRRLPTLLASATLILAIAVAPGACSSSRSSGSSAPTTTATGASSDPASTVATLCDARRRLDALSQATSGTDPNSVSDVAQNIVVLRDLSEQLAAHPPPSIAGPVRRYAAVMRYVADTLAQQPTSQDTSVRQLSQADSTLISRYVLAHCHDTASPTTTGSDTAG